MSIPLNKNQKHAISPQGTAMKQHNLIVFTCKQSHDLPVKRARISFNELFYAQSTLCNHFRDIVFTNRVHLSLNYSQNCEQNTRGALLMSTTTSETTKME